MSYQMCKDGYRLQDALRNLSALLCGVKVSSTVSGLCVSALLPEKYASDCRKSRKKTEGNLRAKTVPKKGGRIAENSKGKVEDLKSVKVPQGEKRTFVFHVQRDPTEKQWA